jgi:DNA topoisomerase VI subunit B
MEFFSEKELTLQVGHGREVWPLIIGRELVDNAVDSAEDARRPPKIHIVVDRTGIIVSDNGKGIAPETVADMLDFTSRTSSKEHYVSPTRGQQGLGLKSILPMPFVLDGKQGRVDITAGGVRHEILIRLNQLRQTPDIVAPQHPDRLVKIGTRVRVHWPEVYIGYSGRTATAFFTNGRELRLLQSPRHVVPAMVRSNRQILGYQPEVAEVAAQRSDCARLVLTRTT